MTSPLIDLTLMTLDEQQLVDAAKVAIETQLPTVNLIEGNTEVVLLEAGAIITGQVQYTLNQIPQMVIDGFLGLYGIQRNGAAQATGSINVTMAAATVGNKILPAGTRFRQYNSDGSSFDLLTLYDTPGYPTDSLVITALVEADLPGAFPNSIAAGTTVVLVDVLSWVDSAVTATPLVGGTDPETDAAFYPRAVARLAAQNDTLVVAADYLAAALQETGVGRAYTISAWDGSGSTPGTVGGHVTVAVATAAGGATSSLVKTQTVADLTARAIAGMTVHVVDPTFKAFVATVQINVAAGFVSADVISAVTRAVAAYLDPSTRQFGQELYLNQLIVIAGEVPGVDRVITASGTVGGTNVTGYTPGILDLPAGPATVNVTSRLMYEQNGKNLLPLDVHTGGMAGFVGWLHPDGSVATDNGDLTLTLPEDTGIATAVYPAGSAVSPIKVSPGAFYTAACSCTRLIAITIRWIFTDGTVSGPATGFGTDRAVVTAMAPANAKSALIELFAPTARVTSQTATEQSISYWSIAQVAPYGVIADDEGPPAPVLLSGVVFAHAKVDTGPLPPLLVDTTAGQRIWESLPQIYLDADVGLGLPLNKWLHGMWTVIDQAEAIRDQISGGGLTDPTVAPDAWIPWMAQLAGVRQARSIAATRALIQTRLTNPTIGSRKAIAALGKTFLTGTQVCDVFPNPASQFDLIIRVRSDEVAGIGGNAGFAAAMLATGQIPAGYTLTIQTGLPLWSAIDGYANGTWGPLDTFQYWSGIDSIGVTSS